MEFILNEYHRNVSDAELLSDMVAVATKLQKTTVTSEEYPKYGKYHSSTITRRFGSWTEALKKAGLKTQQELRNCCASLEDFIADVKAVAKQLGQDTVTTGEYKQYGKYNYLYAIDTHNKAWNDVLKIAQLKPTPFRLGRDKTISNEELFNDIERVWINLGRQPTITDLKNGYFKFGQNTFVRRFGGWRGALVAFVNYINAEDIGDADNIKDDAIENDMLICDESSQQLIHHKTKREPNLRLRFKVMHRDNFKCCQCGRTPATDPSVELVLDHVLPWVKGGETTYDNLRTLCRECNLGKSDLVYAEL